jgi:hypothetical protein
MGTRFLGAPLGSCMTGVNHFFEYFLQPGQACIRTHAVRRTLPHLQVLRLSRPWRLAIWAIAWL